MVQVSAPLHDWSFFRGVCRGKMLLLQLESNQIATQLSSMPRGLPQFDKGWISPSAQPYLWTIKLITQACAEFFDM
jgi:hypothetical protein